MDAFALWRNGINKRVERNEKGITLVSLIVTVILLLILAVVGIYLIATSSGGIIYGSRSITKGVRPVITLKADILATAGDGNNESTAWQIK